MKSALLKCGRVVLGLIAVTITACSSGDSATGGGAGAEPWLTIKPTWDSIYTGYFGPSGVASCSTGSTCHTSLDQSGGTASNFVCPDKDACYASLMGNSHLIRAADVMDPAKTPFLAKLRQTTGSGRMPSSSKFVFQSGDIDVLEAWITKGAKND
jgi:hypothetical protein